MSNMDIYECLRTPPKDALRTIKAGRLRGFTDINPMWRIKAMTEAFGPCGIGWGTTDETFWLESGADEVTVQCSLRLWYRDPETGDKSEPIFGVGGSKLLAVEKGDPRLDDEAYKKARTDAIGVAMKDIGMAADVYFAADASSKYGAPSAPEEPHATQMAPVCEDCNRPIAGRGKTRPQEIAARSKAKFGRVLCVRCGMDELARQEAQHS